MGYGGSTFKTLAGLRRDGTLAGLRNVMDLGAQEGWTTPDYVTDFLTAFGLTNPDPAEVDALIAKRFVKYIWERVGVEYTSTDYDAQFETLLLDLNYDDVPPAHRNRYDLTTNCGTTEHVVNQMNSFRIIHDLTRPGGYMLHDLPWSGMFNHGLFNYKPTLFWRLCQSNYYNFSRMWLRAQVNEPAELPANILAACSDADQEVYKKYFSYDGAVMVLLQKTVDMPFVCPLDMEDATMILPGTTARRRYWTLAEPNAYAEIEAHRRNGFPNAEDTLGALQERCDRLEAQISRMEGSLFWKARTLLARAKRRVLSRPAPQSRA